jgi:hypothetical protein
VVRDCLIKILESLSIVSGWRFRGAKGEQWTVNYFFHQVLFKTCDEDPILFEPTMDTHNGGLSFS